MVLVLNFLYNSHFTSHDGQKGFGGKENWQQFDFLKPYTSKKENSVWLKCVVADGYQGNTVTRRMVDVKGGIIECAHMVSSFYSSFFLFFFLYYICIHI